MELRNDISWVVSIYAGVLMLSPAEWQACAYVYIGTELNEADVNIIPSPAPRNPALGLGLPHLLSHNHRSVASALDFFPFESRRGAEQAMALGLPLLLMRDALSTWPKLYLDTHLYIKTG